MILAVTGTRRFGFPIAFGALAAACVGFAQDGERSVKQAEQATKAWNAPDPTWVAPGSASMAEARLRALWPAIAAAAPGATAAFGGARLEAATSARPIACRDAAARVRDTVGERDPAALGSVKALGDGSCWEMNVSAGLRTLLAYLRATDGSLAMLWVPPEE